MDRRLIIFDFDGTLGDTRANIVKTMQRTIDELHLPRRSDDDCAKTIGLPLEGCFEALYEDMSIEHVKRCAATYRRLFDENLLTLKPQPFPKVAETLARLKSLGHTLTIASSRSHASLAALTKDMGLADSMALVVGADDVNHAKPDAEPVLKTLAAMGCAPSDTLVVGDMAVDIVMGTRAGATTCGVTWGNGRREELLTAGADYIIDSMDELLAVVESLDLRRIRRATAADMPAIMTVFAAARTIMRRSGNHRQWTDGYPSESIVARDMERGGAFVVVDGGRVVGYFAFLPSPEPTYGTIYDGQWTDDMMPYHVVHRIAGLPDVHGIFKCIMDYCWARERNIRIDTHRDNHIMQHLMAKHGFVCCGIIYLASGDERLAYQRIVN